MKQTSAFDFCLWRSFFRRKHIP